MDKKTKLETKQLITAYATLMHQGDVEFEMHIPCRPMEESDSYYSYYSYYRDKEIAEYNDRIQQIIELIRSMDSFNNKDNQFIAFTFGDFYNELPQETYTNGGPRIRNLFDKFIFTGDDGFAICGTEFCNPENDWNSRYDLDAVRKNISKYKQKWCADVGELRVEDGGFCKGYTKYTIRFWWD